MALRVVGAAIVRGQTCLVARRRGGDRSWEFPGGKIEPGETPHAALIRELEEELGVVAVVGEHIGRGYAREGALVLDVYLARVEAGEPVAHEHESLAWVEADALAALAWAEADVPIVPRVAAHLRLLGSV